MDGLAHSAALGATSRPGLAGPREAPRKGRGACAFECRHYAIVGFSKTKVSAPGSEFHKLGETREPLLALITMALMEQIQKDLTAAMMSKDELRLSVLRMVKSALKYKEIEKVRHLEDAEALQVLQTLLKQRRESVEQFTKGNRPELAEKEQKEIELIDGYMPKAASEEDVRAIVHGAIEQITADNAGTNPGPKDMGAVMKIAQARGLADGARIDGRLLSELVKAELAKQ